MTKPIIAILLVAIISFVAGIMIDGSRLPFGSSSNQETAHQKTPHETAMEHAKKHLDPNYVCPMHSEIVSDKKGTCPICGMDLVEIRHDAAADASDDGYPEVRIPSTMINNMGVRVAEVERKTLVRTIETPGFIQQMSKASYSRYTAPASGRVVKFHFHEGQWHEAGEPLIDIALDDLVLVQQKHLQLLKEQAGTATAGTTPAVTTPAVEAEAESTPADDRDGEEPEEPAQPASVDKTRALMKLAGMTDEQIDRLEQTGETSPVITMYASHAGEVKELRVAVGDEVKSRQLLFTLGGLMRVSVLANAFQRDASWVKAGQDVDIILPHDSQQPWKGKVSSGAVSINTNSQNIGVRLSFEAPDSVVKSGMYVVGNIYGQVREDTLTVPRDAVIYSRDEKRVIEVVERGRFKPVKVETGISNDTEIEILSGLEEGDVIVVSAQFLIDSESSLQASYRRMKTVE